jgi:hypothetical protein
MTDEEGESGQNGSGPKVRVIAPIEGLENKTQVAPSRISYTVSRNCTYHPNLPAIYICAQCQSPLCGSCGIPYGQLYLCSQCYLPPTPTPQKTETKPPEKPPIESVLNFFGGLLIFIGFLLPWASSDYTSPRFNDIEPIVSGFTIARDYPEVILVFTMGILIMVIEFILIILATSPSMLKRPPVGIKVVSMFLAFVCYIVMLEILVRAETFAENIQGGWFVCFIGASICVWQGFMILNKQYKEGKK